MQTRSKVRPVGDPDGAEPQPKPKPKAPKAKAPKAPKAPKAKARKPTAPKAPKAPKPFVLDESILKLNPHNFSDMQRLIEIVHDNGWDWTSLQRPYFYEAWHCRKSSADEPFEEEVVTSKKHDFVVRWPKSVKFTWMCGLKLQKYLSLEKLRDPKTPEKLVVRIAEACLSNAAASGAGRDVIDEIVDYGAENLWQCISEAAKFGHNRTIKYLYLCFEKLHGDVGYWYLEAVRPRAQTRRSLAPRASLVRSFARSLV